MNYTNVFRSKNNIVAMIKFTPYKNNIYLLREKATLDDLTQLYRRKLLK